MESGKSGKTSLFPGTMPPASTKEKQLIAIGASTGGTEAIAAILKNLSPPLPPIVIVQHIPPIFSNHFAHRLNAISKLTVKEAEDGEPLKDSTAYVAPGGQHMKLERRSGRLAVTCTKGDPVNWVRPSADVLFFTVAELVGDAALGIILTGMGADGAKGLFAMRLSNPSYLLHGTNKPEGVGMRVSHGCIRLYPEGIEELFGMVAPGTKVNIINQPMKVGWFGDSMYLEFHAPLGEDARTLEQNIAEARETVHKSIASRGLQVSNDLIDAGVREETGLPVEVAYR